MIINHEHICYHFVSWVKKIFFANFVTKFDAIGRTRFHVRSATGKTGLWKSLRISKLLQLIPRARQILCPAARDVPKLVSDNKFYCANSRRARTPWTWYYVHLLVYTSLLYNKTQWATYSETFIAHWATTFFNIFLPLAVPKIFVKTVHPDVTEVPVCHRYLQLFIQCS